MKTHVMLLTALFAALSVFTACTNYGTEKEFNGVQLFYTDAVSEAEADALGEYLTQSGFADGEKKTVQLTKEGDTFQFRMVVVDNYKEIDNYESIFSYTARNISELVFDNKPVELHACNDKLETLEVFEMSEYLGESITAHGVQLYYSENISEELAVDFLDYLKESGFADGDAKTVQLERYDDMYIFKIIVDADVIESHELDEAFYTYAQMLSENVFDNNLTEIHACNNNFSPIGIFSSQEQINTF